ncbi:hypothetical protein [Methylovirgula sp. HY1]|uniref:hypothetical protein n=1 Tax=Methylovirgula sp. HY1 TaxID=2822761 RepID=UPI001C5AFEF7|nr:hypothetical protein [Methylovirgula sp. HY1]QXX74216.1 hypothetical protein MHY1_01026 [Methylovirgula sp. HY1]
MSHPDDHLSGGIWSKDMARIWAAESAANVLDFLAKHRPGADAPTNEICAHACAQEMARALQNYLANFPKAEI